MDWGEILNRVLTGLGRFVTWCFRNWRITLPAFFVIMVWLNWPLVYSIVVTVLGRLAIVGILFWVFYLLFRPFVSPIIKGAKKDK